MVHVILALSVLVAFILFDKKGLIMAFTIIFVFAAIRYDFGNDYMSYLEDYNLLKTTLYNPYNKQFLFLWFNKISPSFYVLIALTSFITIFSVYWLIKNNVSTEYYALGFLIFVINPYIFLMNLSAIRQALALTCFIFAVHFSAKKKIVPYILLIIAAALFHKSAIVLLPFYFLANEKKIKLWQVIALIMVLLILLLSPDALNKLIIEFLQFFDDKNYNYYVKGEMQNSLRATLLSSVYFLYVLINIRRIEGKTLLYSKLYVFAVFFAILAYKFSMFTRFQMYFDVFSVVSIPGIIKYNNENNQDFASKILNVYFFPALIFVIYMLRYYSFFTNPMWESFTTYQTIFGV